MEQILLATFKKGLDDLEINAAFRTYKGKQYPYLTYEYLEYGTTHEDGGTQGEMLCEIWTRGKFEELTDIKEKLKRLFKETTIIVDGNAYYFDYANSTPEKTGDKELKKLKVSINTKYFIGE